MIQARSRQAAVVVIVAFLFIITACQAKEDEEGSPLVNLMPYSFAPSTLTVEAGSQVTLRLHNTETFQGEPHTWVLMEAGYRAEAPWTDEDQQHVLAELMVHPNQTETLEFSAPDEPGEYQIACRVLGHLEAGMQGKLVVTP